MNEALLAAAFRMQQAGDLAEAAKLYGEILRSNPRHFRALYMLAHLHLGSGSFETAERLFDDAATLNPKIDDVHFARGCALHNLGRYEEAIVAFDKALALKRGHADALVNRGLSLTELGHSEEALADFDRALAVNPRHVDALVNRGATQLDLKRHAEAASSLERALALSPNHVTGLINMANALRGLGRLDDALAGYDRVFALMPDNVEALSNRGVLLLELKRYAEALQSFERALAIRPDHVAAWFNRGTAFLETRRYRDAVASFERVLALQPMHIEAIMNRAVVLLSERRFEEALAGFESALVLDPHRADALGNRAAALYELRRYEEAIADGETLIAVQPDYPYARGLILRSRLHGCDWRSLAKEKAELDAAIDAGKRAIQPFAYLALSESSERQLACAQIHSVNEFPASSSPLWHGERYRHDRVRVAYLSADFHSHATAALMAGVFEHHDRTRFEIFAMSYGPDDRSEMRARLLAAFEHFIDVASKSDEDVARLLIEKEIDIAVDLKGFTQDSRPGILAFRPAPVQAHYLGFPGTMGAPYVDYLIADAVVVPDVQASFYSEAIAYLPDTYQCNDRKRRIAERPATRAEAGLPETGFVFCCFNNSYKIAPEIFAIWMRLLATVEGSVLWLLDDNPPAVANLRREAEAAGVAAERLRFAPKMAPAEHLARHRLADLFLDTLPYNAHTTASDALWAGLPVLTCAGETFAGRVAASLLHAVGLPELVTHSLKAYEALALELASKPPILVDMKSKLGRNRDTHPLFDTAHYTRNLESAFVTMRERHQRGEKPKGFAVGRVP